MKYIILFFLLITFSSLAIAQIQKGTGYFEGALSGSYQNGENPQFNNTSTYTSNYWSFNISYGHYLTSSFAIGIGAGVNLSDYKNKNASVNFYSSNRQLNTLYYVSPFIRTSKRIIDNFYCFGNLSLMAGSGLIQSTSEASNFAYQKTESTQMSLGIGLTGGLNYFLNRHFALTLSYGNLSYSNTTVEENNSDSNEKTKSDALNLNLGLSSIAIGLQYFINNAEKK